PRVSIQGHISAPGRWLGWAIYQLNLAVHPKVQGWSNALVTAQLALDAQPAHNAPQQIVFPGAGGVGRFTSPLVMDHFARDAFGMLSQIAPYGLLQHPNARLGDVMWIHGFLFPLVVRLVILPNAPARVAASQTAASPWLHSPSLQPAAPCRLSEGQKRRAGRSARQH